MDHICDVGIYILGEALLVQLKYAFIVHRNYIDNKSDMKLLVSICHKSDMIFHTEDTCH